MEILGAVPGSVLWLKHSNDLACERLCAAATAKGIDPKRIVFALDLPDKNAHIARLQLADLGLDTFGRYNGHTSTADALWSGVPVVTTASECFPGRVSASLLTAAGMSECVTTNVDAYKALAIRFATDPATRQYIRSALNYARERAPFFQPEGVVRALERAYEAMWERYTSGQQPVAIDLCSR
jgi:predicted O-linked N-acetylglucosamine transferase (SPINDLY family)